MKILEDNLKIISGYLMDNDDIYLLGYNPIRNTVGISISGYTVNLDLERDDKGYYVTINRYKYRVQTKVISDKERKRIDKLTEEIIDIMLG